jgi:hypothetical protein
MERLLRLMLLRASPTIICVCVGASNLNAECLQQTARSVMSHALVFAGTVVEITSTGPEGARVTFEVDRVWKGSVTRHFDLYVWYRQAEIPTFETGQRHLAIADPLVKPEVRRDVGVDDKNTVAYSAAQCSDRPSLVPSIEADLGTGALPKG